MQQESISDQHPYQTKTGLGLNDIAAQAREQYLSVLAQECSPWEEADQDEKAHWLTACEGLTEFLAEERDSSFQAIAKLFATVYYGRDRWSSLKTPFRIAHEVAVRHVINIATAEDDDDMRDATNHNWQEWFLKRMEKDNGSNPEPA